MSLPLPPPDDPDDDAPAFDDVLAPDAVRSLAERSVRRGLTSAFQGLLAALIEAVAEAAVPVRTAEAAAISLAQQTHVAAVADGLDSVGEALREGLTEQGLALLPAPPGPVEAIRALVNPSPGWLPRLRPRPEPVVLSWGEAMVAAGDALAQAADYAATLAAAQPDGSSARLLGEGLAARLERDRDTLVDEAARTGE
ncbi:MAG TPA: hypothetical protein VF576_07815 [Rubricoccaceae bacterium]|jgi:hypothetical protein